MKEKVYTVHNYWDMTIISGVADYHKIPHYFHYLDPKQDDDASFFSDRYQLTIFSPEILALELQNWTYWLDWLRQEGHVPHPNDYRKRRMSISLEEILQTDNTISRDVWMKAEEYYQNEIIIQDYLQSTLPLPYQIRGDFSGNLNGTDTYVEWVDLL